MQRPIVFLATADPTFENLAIEAVIHSGHGVRRAASLADAVRILAERPDDVALAIIDLALVRRDQALADILHGVALDFPVLAIQEDGPSRLTVPPLAERAWTILKKPIAITDLTNVVEILCRPLVTETSCAPAA